MTRVEWLALRALFEHCVLENARIRRDAGEARSDAAAKRLRSEADRAARARALAGRQAVRTATTR